MAEALVKHCPRIKDLSGLTLNIAANVLGFPPEARSWSDAQMLEHFQTHGDKSGIVSDAEVRAKGGDVLWWLIRLRRLVRRLRWMLPLPAGT